MGLDITLLQDSGEKQVSPVQDWPMLVWGHLQAPGCASSLWRFSIFLERILPGLRSDLKQSVGSLLDFYAKHGLAFTNVCI